MLTFLARRLVQMVPLLVGITFLSFLIVGLAPGDFFSSLAMNPTIAPEAVAKMSMGALALASCLPAVKLL